MGTTPNFKWRTPEWEISGYAPIIFDLDVRLKNIMDLVSASNKFYYPTNITTITGVVNFGNLISLLTFSDNNTYSVQEVNGVPGFDVRIDFSSITSFTKIIYNAQYENGTHHVYLQAYNFNTTTWVSLIEMVHSDYILLGSIDIPDSAPFVSSGNVNLRFYHTSNGQASDELKIDYIVLR